MIELHYWPTPNGWQIAIMLEECGLPYRMVPVNIGRGEQFRPQFLALLHAQHTMPAIIDHRPAAGRVPLSVTQSAAILLYLSEKSGQLLPAEGLSRLPVLQWLHWQVTRLGPTVTQLLYFREYAAAPLPAVVAHHAEALRTLYAELEQQLQRTGAYVGGSDYSLADIAILPWIRMHRSHRIALSDLPHLQRWLETVGQRPAVQRGLALGKDLRAPVLSDAARQQVFGRRAPPAQPSPP